jgi:hypothetical protein
MSDTPKRRADDFEVHDTGTFRMIAEESLRMQTVIGLLQAAKCPNCDGGGAYYDGNGEPAQCEWCAVRADVMREDDG